MTKYLYTFLALTFLMLAGCNKAKEEPQKEVYHNVRTIPTEIVDKGNQAVQNANKRDAGFVSNRVNALASEQLMRTTSTYSLVLMRQAAKTQLSSIN